MKNIIMGASLIALVLTISGCGGSTTITKPEQVSEKVKITKSKFDKNESYTAGEMCVFVNACKSTYHLRGWKQDDGSIEHQIYFAMEWVEFATPPAPKEYRLVKLVGGKSLDLKKISSKNYCYNHPYTLCANIEHVAVEVTTEMLENHRESGLEMQLVSGMVGGNSDVRISAIYIDGVLKALGL